MTAQEDGVLWARHLVLTHAGRRHGGPGKSPAVRDVSLSVRPGETLALTGSAGTGKSTLLHCLAGILTPDEGEVWFDGRPIHALRERARSRLRRSAFGIVPQFSDLVPDLTVEENVALPLMLDGRPRPTALAAARAWLRRLELDELAQYRARRLEPGPAQRAAVARALAGDRRVVLADEPTGPATPAEGERLLRILTTAARSHGIALVLAARDDSVAEHADRHVRLDEGSVVEGEDMSAADVNGAATNTAEDAPADDVAAAAALSGSARR